MLNVNLFIALQSLCGLSSREAADYLGCSESAVNKFRTGKKRAGVEYLTALRDLWSAIDAAAVMRAEEMALDGVFGLADTIEIGYPADDAEARLLGFPCVGAWRQMLARTIDELMLTDEDFDLGRIRLVPRGSTPATALAADMRETADRAPGRT